MTEYAKRLQDLRKKKGLTQDELAEKLHTSRSRVSMYEQGKRQPDFEMQEAIADFFNVNIDYLFGRSDGKMDVLIETASKLSEEDFAMLLAYAQRLNR